MNEKQNIIFFLAITLMFVTMLSNGRLTALWNGIFLPVKTTNANNATPGFKPGPVSGTSGTQFGA
jgi:hypothetical protein